MRFPTWLALVPLIAIMNGAAGQPAPDLDQLRAKPISADGGKVGQLLKQWWKEGSASGNAGDFYDNRDGDHSPLNMAPYPQLSAIKYTEDDIKLKKNWAAARLVRPHVTFGNSSTSAPAHLGGSNPRSYYVSPFGLDLLYKQYVGNNIYFYPEHRDHDPGHNGAPPPAPPGRGAGGEGGYGDMYPTNTPYLIISQGSSGSDQPFMRMMPVVLAAFRPEVKKKLIETGTLMPTIQMLFRSTNKHLKDPKEYLTGKAHPTVFEGGWVDELALVQKAHALELSALPPMVQLRVLEEDKAVNGIDYIDRAPSEVIAYTPACIARVHRSKAYRQRIVVDAGASYDLNKAKLIYTWVVLRGDPDKIKIEPKNAEQSAAEITIAWHERRPVSPGSPLESNRVDIGVFVHNGTHYSAPGFITLHTLDRESRTYNRDGKILDIAHVMGETEVRVTDWQKLLTHITTTPADQQILAVNADEKAALGNVSRKHGQRLLDVKVAQLKVEQLEAFIKTKPNDAKEAKAELVIQRKQLADAQKSLRDLFETNDNELGDSPRRFFEARLALLTRDPLFTEKHADWLKKKRTPANEPRIKALWQKLHRYGVATTSETLMALLPGKTLAENHWTKFELAQLEFFHASLLSELALPGMVQVNYQVNYTDHRLSVPREWRDVYRYNSKGEYSGWMRYSAAGIQSFNHEGLLAVEKDEMWRVKVGRTVRYLQDPIKGFGINTNPLRVVLGDTLVHYEFSDRYDLNGRRVKTETVKDEKK